MVSSSAVSQLTHPTTSGSTKQILYALLHHSHAIHFWSNPARSRRDYSAASGQKCRGGLRPHKTQAGSRLQKGPEHRPEAVGRCRATGPRRRAEERRERAEEGLELAPPRLHLRAPLSSTTLNFLEKQMRSLPVLGR